jgi:hypothetical protein
VYIVFKSFDLLLDRFDFGFKLFDASVVNHCDVIMRCFREYFEVGYNFLELCDVLDSDRSKLVTWLVSIRARSRDLLGLHFRHVMVGAVRC